MKLRLKIVKGSGEGKSFVFNKPHVRIGRGEGNDLVLNDDGISRLQCELVLEPAGLMLRDLTSANGTKVNDVVATETELEVGDTIGMGPVVFEVLELDRQDGAAPAAKANAVVPVPMGDGDPGTKPAPPPRKPSEMVTKVAGRITGIFKTPDVHRSPEASASQRRVLRLAALTALVVATLGAYYIAKHTKPDESFRIFPIGPATQGLSFGKGDVDIVASDRATFTFDSRRGHLVIGYAAASIERADQVEIVVNGERVGYAPQTASGWTTGLRIIVPRRLLKADHNIVIFDNLDIPARGGHEDDRWAIAQLSVTEAALPAADDKAGAELQTTFEAHMLSAEEALRFGDTERARDALRDVLRYFPDANDPRHQAAKERLSELGLNNAH